MAMRIGLISDVHATPEPVAEALALFKSQGVDRILCPGDIAGYGEELEDTVALLTECGCQAILGNHEIWCLENHANEEDTLASRWFASLPRVLQLTHEGRRIYVVHASPPDSNMDGIKFLDLDGHVIEEAKDYWSGRLSGFQHDVLVVGHTHQVFCEQCGNTLVINPGSTRFNHSCAILSLPEQTLELFSLSGQQVIKTWYWGMNDETA